MTIFVIFVAMLWVVLVAAVMAAGTIETLIIAGKIDQRYGGTAAVVFTIVAMAVLLTTAVLLLNLPMIFQI